MEYLEEDDDIVVYDDQIFNCTDCGVYFKTEKELQDHDSLLHNKKQKRHIRCPFEGCDEMLSTKRDIAVKHIHMYHDTSCTISRIEFDNEDEFRDWMTENQKETKTWYKYSSQTTATIKKAYYLCAHRDYCVNFVWAHGNLENYKVSVEYCFYHTHPVEPNPADYRTQPFHLNLRRRSEESKLFLMPKENIEKEEEETETETEESEDEEEYVINNANEEKREKVIHYKRDDMSANDFLAGLVENMMESEEPQTSDAPQYVTAIDDTTEVMDLCSDYYMNDPSPQPQPTRRTKKLTREIQNLSFANPGGEMSRFLPETGDIISKKRSRRTIATTKPTYEEGVIDDEYPLYHDRNGKLVAKSCNFATDLCDCLILECSGCQWPCQSCKSRKCGITCRHNRKEVITKIEELCTVENSKNHKITVNPCWDQAVHQD